MSTHIQVPLTNRTSIQFNNHRHGLIIQPERFAPSLYDTLVEMGYRLVGVQRVKVPVPDAIQHHLKDLIVAPLSSLTGHLGQFEALATIGDKQENLGVFHPGDSDFWDIVLDGGDSPWFSGEVPPLGYFRKQPTNNAQSKKDPPNHDEWLESLSQWSEGYKKPKYFDYDPDKCAHFNLDHTGCTRCLDACPALAITSSGGHLTYDPNVCQGCGTCVLTCPTGAVTYAIPKVRDILRELLESLYQGEATPTNTLLRISETRLGGAERTTELALPEVTAAGADLWLNALGMGYAGVVIAPQKPLSSTARKALEDEIARWNTVLDSERIALDYFDAIPEKPLVYPLPASFRSWPSGKQALIHHALDRLLANRPELLLSLPANTPLGQIRINTDTCSQCLACAQLCPVDALTSGEDDDSLWFEVQRCTQCGICAEGCPEKAITLTPELPVAPEARKSRQKLFDVAQARCRVCGTPFMSKKVLDSITQKLSGDSSINQELIQTCQACRVDAFFGFNSPRDTPES